MFVGYQKRDTLSENRKNCLALVNIKAKKQRRGLGRFFVSPEARAAQPLTRCRLCLAEAPSPEAPRRKASDEVPILCLARGRLGNDPITAASTDFSDKTSCPTNTFNHSHNVSRTTA